MSEYKSGFAAVVGRPNVGKSTLMNRVLGQKIAIATDKAQTTRRRIKGIFTNEEGQIVFIDTPGIHKPLDKLGEFLLDEAKFSIPDADVILVADIDRGGVFASAYGSIALQLPEDRKRIKGIIVNKFRGDLRLFESGVKLMEETCGVPVLGVIPYYKDIYIEEEDSLELQQKQRSAVSGKVNIAVVLLRHLSNFTDFNRLERDERVNLYYTNNTEEISKADIVIMPGTKSTLDDLLELRRNGVAEAVQSLEYVEVIR